MRQYHVDRRTTLLASGAAFAGLAGCLGDADQSGDATGNDSDDDATGDDHGEDDGHGDESTADADDGHDDGTTADADDGHDDAEEMGHHEHGHGHEDAHDHVLGEPADAITVELVTDDDGHHFLPHVVHVEAGGTVTWKLDSGAHDAVAYHADNDRPQRMPADAEPWDTGLLEEQGATVERTFDVEGVYDYYCSPHESLGMVARVVVGEPDLHDEPAMAEPQDSIPAEARDVLRELNTRVEDALGHH